MAGFARIYTWEGGLFNVFNVVIQLDNITYLT
jgi:hypothetical protein